jgi:hypothetical protein
VFHRGGDDLAYALSRHTHPVGKRVDSWPRSLWQALYREQKRIGIEAYPEFPSVIFRGFVKTTNLIPELGEFTVLV